MVEFNNISTILFKSTKLNFRTIAICTKCAIDCKFPFDHINCELKKSNFLPQLKCKFLKTF